jgi:transposase-like protein
MAARRVLPRPVSNNRELRERALSYYECGLSAWATAERVGVSHRIVTKWAKEAGVYRDHPKSVSVGWDTPERRALRNRVVAMYQGGWHGTSSIASELGLYESTVYRWLVRAGVRVRSKSEAYRVRRRRERMDSRE